MNIYEKKFWIGAALLALAIFVLYCFVFAGPPESNAQPEQFVVPLVATTSPAAELQSDGFIKSEFAFHLALTVRGKVSVSSGGYMISKSMNVWQVAGVLTSKPALIWVSIPEGLRKEQIADILAKNLGWTDAQKTEWITVDTTSNPDYVEGVYFPSTYLIPANESPSDTAKRMQDYFNEVFAPYAQIAINENIKWTTALKVASLIQHEAAGTSDMPLISGIIWNRLNANMELDIDSTIQYIVGTEANWWPKVTPAEIQTPSPYNTYLNTGLPPTPIDDPGIPAISAALSPATTTCLYYLHDSNGMIHCSDTYAQQEANVAKYLQ